MGDVHVGHDGAVAPNAVTMRSVVARWMVTHSRMLVRSPISTVVGSPLYFRSCESAPTTQPGKNLQSRPTVVFPSNVAFGPIKCLLNIHLGSDECKGFDNHPSAKVRRRIDVGKGETLADSWIIRVVWHAVPDDLGQHFSFGDKLTTHVGSAFMLTNPRRMGETNVR